MLCQLPSLGGGSSDLTVYADRTGYGNGKRDFIYISASVEASSEEEAKTLIRSAMWDYGDQWSMIPYGANPTDYSNNTILDLPRGDIPRSNSDWNAYINGIKSQGRLIIEIENQQRICQHYSNGEGGWGAAPFGMITNVATGSDGKHQLINSTVMVNGAFLEDSPSFTFTLPDGHNPIGSIEDPNPPHDFSNAWMIWIYEQNAINYPTSEGMSSVNTRQSYCSIIRAAQGKYMNYVTVQPTRRNNSADCGCSITAHTWLYPYSSTSRWVNGSRFSNNLIGSHSSARPNSLGPYGSARGAFGIGGNLGGTLKIGWCPIHNGDTMGGKCVHVTEPAHFENEAYSNSSTLWNHTINTYIVKMYRLNNYNIRYHGNGATTGEDQTQTTLIGTPATIWNNWFTKTGYTFIGWYDTPNSTGGTKYEEGSSYTINTDIDLYARWQPIKYNVNVYPNPPEDATSTVIQIK